MKKTINWKKERDIEWDKAYKDSIVNGFGVYDPILKKRIDSEHLVFIWPGEGKKRMQKELVINRSLMVLEKIYNEKFVDDPYELKLFNKDKDLFVERLIRAVEICTLRWVLSKGGVLNMNKHTVTKGRKRFLWE